MRVRLFGKGTFAPIDPAVEAEIGSVQIIGATGQRFGIEPDFALIGEAVVIGVSQLPD